VLSLPDTQAVEGALLTISLFSRAPDEPARAGVQSIQFRTDTEGRFSVPLTPGRYSVRVEAFGFEEGHWPDVQIHAEQTSEVSFLLDATPFRLHEIVVMPSTYGILGDPLVSGQILTREELETQPQLGNDIFRAVAQVPGVTTQDYTAMPYVRGGRPREVLTMLDGVELYEPYHMKMWDGSLSIVGVENVSDVDLTTGGFTVEHGDASTGVFSMRTATPGSDRTSTTVGLDFMSSILQSKGTFGAEKGAWMVSARRGFLDLVFEITGRNDEEDLHPSYYDVFSKVEYEIRPGHMVSAHLLHAGDNNHGIEEDSTVYVHRYGSSYGWMTWEADFRDNLSARSVLSLGRITRDRDGADYWEPADPPGLEVRDQADFDFLGLRQEWRYQHTDQVMLKFGFDTKWGQAAYDYLRWEKAWIPNSTNPAAPGWTLQFDTLSLATERSGTEIGAYLAGRMQPFSALTLEAGLRYDRQSHTGGQQLAPRINAALQVFPSTTLRGAWGHFHQSHGLHQLWVADGDLEFFPAQRAEHRVLGLEHRFQNGLSVRLEAYDRLLTDPLPEYRSLEDHVEGLREESHGDRVFLEPDRGRARGIELFAKSSGRSWFAWSASYALSETKELIDGEWAPLPFDQRHAVNLQLTLRPTSNWSINAGWVYHSPWPFTSQHFSPATTVDGYVYILRDFGPLNQERLIPYKRFDFRASRWFRTSRGDLLVYLDVFNLTNRENAQAADYGAWWYQGQLITDQTYHIQLEVMPSIGLRWTF
jgi:outer membrane receptor protein involved in Fe transport